MDQIREMLEESDDFSEDGSVYQPASDQAHSNTDEANDTSGDEDEDCDVNVSTNPDLHRSSALMESQGLPLSPSSQLKKRRR